jgi:hypothetical protein
MRRVTQSLFFAAQLSLVAALGCNAVLGIEKAEYDPDVGQALGGSGGAGGTTGAVASANTPRVIPLASCNAPTTECQSCLEAQCSSQLAESLTTVENREKLDAYRACLGSQCADNDSFDCLELAPILLATCVTGACSSECSTSPLVSTCELYCACMESNCLTEVQDTLAGDCRASCEANLEYLSCRRAHCEFATPELPIHCQHALGVGECPRLSGVASKCDYRRVSGWTCRSHAECCSGDCDSTIQMCN